MAGRAPMLWIWYWVAAAMVQSSWTTGTTASSARSAATRLPHRVQPARRGAECEYLVGHLGLEALVLDLLALACLTFCLMDAICGLPRLGPEAAKEMSERLWHLGDVGLNDFCLLASPDIEHIFNGRVASAAEPFPDGDDRHLFLLSLQLSDSLANLFFIDNRRSAPARHNVIL